MTTELFTTPTLTLHEHIGFELGWDYAHYHLVPPAPYAIDVANDPVAAKWEPGRRPILTAPSSASGTDRRGHERSGSENSRDRQARHAPRESAWAALL